MLIKGTVEQGSYPFESDEVLENKGDFFLEVLQNKVVFDILRQFQLNI